MCETQAQPPRPLSRREARAEVRSFSNLGLLPRSASAVYESGHVKWDVDMVFEEPEAEPCLRSRSIPHHAACPALGSQTRLNAFNKTFITSMAASSKTNPSPVSV
jgi:hypothetical protein